MQHEEHFFPDNSSTKCGGETRSKPFSKKSKMIISRDHVLTFYTVCIYCMSKSTAIEKY